MKKITLLMLIAMLMIAIASVAGCIDNNTNKTETVENTDEFDIASYVLKDDIQDDDDQTVVTRKYTFVYDGKRYNVNIAVPQYRIDNYRSNKYELRDYQKSFVKDEYIDDVVHQLVMQVSTEDKQKILEVLVAFVQKCIKYEHDIELHNQQDYWAYPVETLINGRGDCDCQATLMTALLRTAGFNAVTLRQKTHVATIVSDIKPSSPKFEADMYILYNDQKYYFVDPILNSGVGSYNKTRFNALYDYYIIYDETSWATYIDGEFCCEGIYNSYQYYVENGYC